MRPIAAVLLLLGGCHAASPGPARNLAPGDRLEQSARDRGLVVDAIHADPIGLYARDDDRICVIASGASFRLGALVRYEDGPACAATGTATRTTDGLAVRFADACRFDATFNGDRIAFPAALPPGCGRFCSGRASMEALSGERLSATGAEAAALRDARGRALCGD